MMENPFILLCGCPESPAGWHYHCERFATLDKACQEGVRIQIALYNNRGWWEVIDLRQEELVAEGGKNFQH